MRPGGSVARRRDARSQWSSTLCSSVTERRCSNRAVTRDNIIDYSDTASTMTWQRDLERVTPPSCRKCDDTNRPRWDRWSRGYGVTDAAPALATRRPGLRPRAMRPTGTHGAEVGPREGVAQ